MNFLWKRTLTTLTTVDDAICRRSFLGCWAESKHWKCFNFFKICNSVPPTKNRWTSHLHISEDELEKMKWNDIHIRNRITFSSTQIHTQIILDFSAIFHYFIIYLNWLNKNSHRSSIYNFFLINIIISNVYASHIIIVAYFLCYRR